MFDPAPAARGVYRPRRPQASPLFRLVSDHLHQLQKVYDERFVRKYGPWRPVVGQVAHAELPISIDVTSVIAVFNRTLVNSSDTRREFP